MMHTGGERNGPGARGWTGPGAAAIVIVAVLVVAVYHATFATLVRTWQSDENYSHGFLIPPVVAFLFFREWRRMVGAISRGALWGLAVIVVALLGHVVSIRAGVFMTQGYSFVLLLYGLALFLLGARATSRIWFPIGYIVFMLPMPPLVVNVLSFRLKLFAARIGSLIVSWLGIPLARSGMTIHLPSGSLRIADPCSGLRSLIALVALGALFAYLTRGNLWKRLVLFASAVPLAVVANIVRISLLCVVADVRGVDAALGFFHNFSGIILFLIAFAGLVIVRRLLGLGRAKEASA
jgi:exosortase A